MKNRVSLTMVSDGGVESAVREAVRRAGGFDDLIGSGSRVLIKPNQCKPCPRRSGFMTDGDVVEAVTRIVLERNPASVVIGDGAIAGWDLGGFSTQEAFDSSGVTDVAKRLGVELRNLNTDAVEEVRVPNAYVLNTVRIAKTALECDVIISVPVLKMGSRTHVSLSLKNMKGVMPGAEKRRSHLVGLDMAIADLCTVVKPHYAIIDATVGSEGMGQYPQDAREMGLIVAGSEPLYVDVVGAALMGVTPDEVLHFRYVGQRQGMRPVLDDIDLVGEPLDAHRQVFARPFDAFCSRYPGVTMIQGDSACSGCINELTSAMIHMKQAGYGDRMNGLTLVIGNASEAGPSERTVSLGKCATGLAGTRAHAPGCPPKESEMVRVIADACGVDPGTVLTSMEEARRKVWDLWDDGSSH